MAKKILMPVEQVLLKMKEAIKEANEDENADMDAVSWGYQEGYLLSFNDCKMIMAYIGNLKLASGRK